jgi:pyruvate dehydrogenase E2 component (dihydrolipoamide acetyltransferase)
VRQTPVVRDGEIAIGEMMFVTISADHRVIDGATAAQYLQELKRLLQSPMSLLV